MSRVSLISPEPIRHRMAGVGVRFLEMARCLAKSHCVRLLAPSVDWPDEAGIRLQSFQQGAFREIADRSDVIVVHGHVSNPLLKEVRDVPLVMDLYDPFLLENMHYAPQLGEQVYRHDYQTLTDQLRWGDFFLCATPQQRLFYLGMLTALGRVTPESFLANRVLDQLVAVLPFGIPNEQPADRDPQLRGVVPGLTDDDVLVLFGGVYDWQDPMTAVRALDILDRDASLGERRRLIKLLLVKNPNPETTPQHQLDAVRSWCRDRDWEGDRVHFLDWIDYRTRDGAYRECDLGVATFARGLEVDLSFRTRILDWLWSGLPVVTTDGGWMSEMLREEKAGLIVEPGNPVALAAAIAELVRSPGNGSKLADRGRRLVTSRFRWKKLIEPLECFCKKPVLAADKIRT